MLAPVAEVLATVRAPSRPAPASLALMAAAFGLAAGIVQNGYYAGSVGAADVAGTKAGSERFNVV
jgi:hypothetical protein